MKNKPEYPQRILLQFVGYMSSAKQQIFFKKKSPRISRPTNCYLLQHWGKLMSIDFHFLKYIRDPSQLKLYVYSIICMVSTLIVCKEYEKNIAKNCPKLLLV